MTTNRDNARYEVKQAIFKECQKLDALRSFRCNVEMAINEVGVFLPDTEKAKAKFYKADGLIDQAEKLLKELLFEV